MLSFSCKNLSLDLFVLLEIFYCSIPTLYYSYYAKEFTESRIYNAEFEENLDLTAEMFSTSKYIYSLYELLGSYGNTTEVLRKPPVSMAKLRMLDVYFSTINCLKLCCCRYATVLQPLPAFYMGPQYFSYVSTVWDDGEDRAHTWTILPERNCRLCTSHPWCTPPLVYGVLYNDAIADLLI